MKMKWQPPRWTKSIKEGSHGSGSMQKRLWTLVSDYTRIRDWYEYGYGISDEIPRSVHHWNQFDAGHWRAYSCCHGYSKFMCLENINAQNKNDNRISDGPTNDRMKEEMLRRGKNIDRILEETGPKSSVGPLQDIKIVEHMETMIEKMKILFDIIQEEGVYVEKPDYYDKVINNL